MSSKIEVSRELLERYVSSVEEHNYGFDGDDEIRAALDAPVVERQPVQHPCGWAKPEDLLEDGYSHTFTVRSEQPGLGDFVPLYTAPPELAELQATIAQLTAENERLMRRDQMLAEVGCEYCGGSGHVSRIDGEYLGVCDQCPSYELNCTKHELDQLKAEIERLKGGQGEAVAVLYADGSVLTKAECGVDFETCCKVETPLCISRPAPASVVLPDPALKTKYLDDEDGYLFDLGWNACLDKVKELNQ